MQNQQDAEAFAQVGRLIDDLMNWIITTEHERPKQIIDAGVNAVNPEQAQRMADEYAIVDALIAILQETRSQLLTANVLPMSYEQQIAARFNELLSPQTALVVHRFLLALDMSPVQDENTRVYAAQLRFLSLMFDRIAFLRQTYESKLQTFR